MGGARSGRGAVGGRAPPDAWTRRRAVGAAGPQEDPPSTVFSTTGDPDGPDRLNGADGRRDEAAKARGVRPGGHGDRARHGREPRRAGGAQHTGGGRERPRPAAVGA
jgi:hypothetical protein